MLRAVIIDDEKRGRETLLNLLNEYCKNLEVVEMANSAKTGAEIIAAQQPDVVFLDIQMPKGTGFDMLESIAELNFEVIFTTAYDKYAIKAIKFAAMDYLLKPVEIDELKAAVDRVKEKVKSKVTGQNFSVLLNNLKGQHNKIALPTSEGISFIPTDNIIRCEASGNYTCFYLEDGGKILVSKTLKEYDELLSETNFYRVHNSHLVNLNHVDKFVKVGGDSVMMSDGSRIEVSRRRKEGFLNRLI
jgi:two-component system LytT family response regulator